MDTPQVLIVDDEPTVLRFLREVLVREGCEVRVASCGDEAAQCVETWEPHVALLDVILPGVDGIRLMGEIKRRWSDAEVLIMTGNATADSALAAARGGAADYLSKPFADVSEIRGSVQRALDRRNLRIKNRALLDAQEARSRRLSTDVALADDDDELRDIANLGGVFDDFLDVVVQELEVDRASLMFTDTAGQELRVVASRGLSGVDTTSIRVPLGDGVAGHVAMTGEPLLVTDVVNDARVRIGSPDRSNSFISAPIVFSVPIKTEREVLGVINVTDRRSGRPFDSRDVAFLSGLARQLGVVIDGARQSRKLQRAYESLKTAQQRLLFNERITAIGQMAAGVANEFNNSLSVILARAEVALADLESKGPEVESACGQLRTIIDTALHAAGGVRKIQDYTRIRKDVPTSRVDLNEVAVETLDSARARWTPGLEEDQVVDVVLQLGDVPPVIGNQDELVSVIEALLFNAVEALPRGGRIQLRTRCEGRSVILEVIDNGIGMDRGTQDRLFEPFFSTKASGRGLGTSVVYGIVTRHQGEVSVSSALGQGSKFVIRIPVAGADPAPAPVRVPSAEVNFRVLLVDDDAMVRDTFAEALTQAGHSVLQAESGEMALRIGESEPFDILITDLSMAGMTGLELATQLKERRPEVPIILLSGWAVQELEEKVRGAGVDVILSKPCLIGDLLSSVRSVAGASPPVPVA